MQRHHLPEAFDHGFEKVKFGECIACSLQEQHGNADIGEMFCPIAGRLSRGVQRKAEERQSLYAGERRDRLRLRRPPPPERSPTCDHRQSPPPPPRFPPPRPPPPIRPPP